MKNKTHTKQEKEKTQKLKNIQYRNKTPQKNTKKKILFVGPYSDLGDYSDGE